MDVIASYSGRKPLISTQYGGEVSGSQPLSTSVNLLVPTSLHACGMFVDSTLLLTSLT